MTIKSKSESLIRAIKRCDANPKYMGTDLLLNLSRQAILKSKRKQQLEENLPDIWLHESVLYVGARNGRIDFGKEFKTNNYKIDVLEIHKPNVDYLKTILWFNHVMQGDVRDISKFTDKSYDVIFWWHGPEHINKSELENTLKGLEKIASKLVVCACPNGVFEQEELYNNPFERHISHLNSSDFKSLGYNTSEIGPKDFPGSNVLAWKRVEVQ